MTARAAIILIAAPIAGACAPDPPAVPLPQPSACVVADDVARPRIMFGVSSAGGEATGGSGDLLRTAHSAADVAAALIARTLVRVDCTGRVTPGLAETWSTADGRSWRFHIGSGMTFTDGTAVNARSVAAALSAAAPPLLAAVAVVSEDDIDITLRETSTVRSFAAAELAVVRRPHDGWPAGTGRYLVDSTGAAGVLRLVARPADGSGAAAHAPDTIDIRTFGTDSRAAIDDRVDAILSGDAATLAYAEARGGYVFAPLPWSRTYVLASVPAAVTTTPDAAGDFGAEVVRTTARAAEPPFWWRACMPEAGISPPRPADDRVVYHRDDTTARGIAERIAALTRGRAPAWLAARLPGTSGPLAAVGVSASELLDALRGRGARLVVISLPRVHHAGCAGSNAPFFERFDGWALLPLIDTREHLIHRGNIGRVTAAADGTIRFGTR